VTLGLTASLPSAVDVTAVAIGDTAVVTIPGELQTRLGLDIKASGVFRRILVAGVTNDYVGYLLTAADYRRPSYIACGSLYGERGGEIVRDAAITALRRLRACGESSKTGCRGANDRDVAARRQPDFRDSSHVLGGRHARP